MVFEKRKFHSLSLEKLSSGLRSEIRKKIQTPEWGNSKVRVWVARSSTTIRLSFTGWKQPEYSRALDRLC